LATRRAGGAVLAMAVALSCDSSPTASSGETCEGYPDWSTSAYVLPYAPPASYTVIQGNCAAPGNGHRGINRYSYDFGTPIGSPVVAARSGVVMEVEESHLDGQVAPTGFDNYIVIRHDDGTFALYGHLTHDGAVVALGNLADQGRVIGYSGNTGNTGNVPHLHFAVHSCDPVTGGSAACPTVPVTFRNTDPNPDGLQAGRAYPARAAAAALISGRR
jgi:murein DD-endopeptidase MepM/ murein hydrolase activator NlpD